ncbi:MAG: NADH-dependent [FeFe] hydrogenase, group A6 [Candidatus Cloacimonadales bacterium]|nr:[FeFe] hydrogenase, group A [Candidatus Cloacimonadota bacterium]MDD2649950.1 NADH-dependent [FeFe] hydrogenase, group A6 [Candidatus Cloacimonadota bacterium]MDD3501132.1 NADH-dependent [FeFe] hydrogenase, group A6 [Candidatus Cloacimonadota bacterium]MDX9977871.1 NADH-dependent [FeFe] hydrogenase, group A6 [Candidatus Cloacimonadales bacterium]
MENLINVVIDGKAIKAKPGSTILEVANANKIYIPTLCWHEELPPTSNCGLCVVYVDKRPQPIRACSTPIHEGMTVVTNTKALRQYRKTLLQLFLANHHVDCPTCVANNNCELQTLCNNMGVEMLEAPPILKMQAIDNSSIAIMRDNNKCISCGRCVTICNEVQKVSALTFVNRGFDGSVDVSFLNGIGNSPCINCGQCIIYCPVGALYERSHVEEVWDAIYDETKHVVVQEAPAIRASLADEFGMDVSEVTPRKMYAALRTIGFDAVMDTNFTADLTIMEEGTELVDRIKNNKPLPLITSCSPGWIKYMETFYPDLAEYVSTAKSPMSMFGVLAKTYYAEKKDINPANIVSVAIMPCTAKKFEANRPELRDSGYQDTDYVLTTREFIRLIKEAGIDFKNLEPQDPDEGMSFYTGAGTIFGATGGVMEAAIRSAYTLITGEELEQVDILQVRGFEGVREGGIEIPGFGELKVAIAHGTGNAQTLMDKVRKQLKETGKCEYHFIEIMGCPGGCVGGGGQPRGNTMKKRATRAQALYTEDKNLKIRKSHQNPEVQKVYEEYLGEPNSPLAQKLLHTYYFERSPITGKAIKEKTHKH